MSRVPPHSYLGWYLYFIGGFTMSWNERLSAELTFLSKGYDTSYDVILNLVML